MLKLTNEITQLERSKADSLSRNSTGMSQNDRRKIEEQFKIKQRELERQLKEVKDKNRQQQIVKKQVDTQTQKIRCLESEISKIKVQKVSAQRKYKEETERHNRLRKEKADEILRMKKANLKKDKEIEKLKKDAKRKEVLSRRKNEEINVLKNKQNLNQKKV